MSIALTDEDLGLYTFAIFVAGSGIGIAATYLGFVYSDWRARRRKARGLTLADTFMIKRLTLMCERPDPPPPPPLPNETTTRGQCPCVRSE